MLFQAIQGMLFRRGQIPPLSRQEVSQAEWAIFNPFELEHLQADCLAHAPDLPVAALEQAHSKNGYPIGHTDHFNPGRPGWAILEFDPLEQLRLSD